MISTESNCDLSKEFVIKNHICVIPHYYTVDEDVYGGDTELTDKEFYDLMREGHKVGTQASNPAVIEEKFTKIVEEGKDILHISFSSNLSGGYSNVVMMSKEVMNDHPGSKIIVLDTLAASAGEAIMIMKALAMQKEGKSIEEVAKELEELFPHIITLFTVDNLDYLYRGGRLSKTSAVIGNVISLKPILRINEEGKLVPLSKTRGRNKSLRTLVDMMEDYLGSYKDRQIKVCLIHGDCEEETLDVKRMIQEKYGFDDFYIATIGPSIGAHSGPGTMGIVFLGEHR